MDYSNRKPDYVVDVLGTEYSIYMNVLPSEDEELEQCDGYHDKTSKRIVVVGKTPDSNLSDFSVYSKMVLRHEIVHAFLHESGIDGHCTWDVEGQEHPEMMCSWLGIQMPKIVKALQEVDAL